METVEFEMHPNDYISCKEIHDLEGFDAPIFALAGPVKGGRVKSISQFNYCRETTCEVIRQEVRGITRRGLKTSKLYVVMNRRMYRSNPKGGAAVFKNQVLAAQEMVNAVERHYGWALTRVYKTKPVKEQQEVPNREQFYYIVASKRWMKAPAMLSLFLLIFRIGRFNSKYRFKGKIKSINDLFKILDRSGSRAPIPDDLATFGDLGPKRVRLLLDNYQDIFGNRGMKKLYYPAKSHRLFTEGIQSACDLESVDRILNTKLSKALTRDKKK